MKTTQRKVTFMNSKNKMATTIVNASTHDDAIEEVVRIYNVGESCILSSSPLNVYRGRS